MTKEQLLQKAIDLYPPGTKFISPFSGDIGIVSDTPEHRNPGEEKICVNSTVSNKYSSFVFYLRWEGKWAEIISVETKIINDYSIY